MNIFSTNNFLGRFMNWIGNIVILINKAITEMSLGAYNCNNAAVLYNRTTGEKYDPNSLVCETNIRNGAILVLD